MDIDAQAKHIIALLADNAELKAFKAWAEPLLLVVEQSAALAKAELEGEDETPAPNPDEADPIATAPIADPASEQEVPTEEGPVVSEEPIQPADAVVSESAPVEEPEPVDVPVEPIAEPAPEPAESVAQVEENPAEETPAPASV